MAAYLFYLKLQLRYKQREPKAKHTSSSFVTGGKVLVVKSEYNPDGWSSHKNMLGVKKKIKHKSGNYKKGCFQEKKNIILIKYFEVIALGRGWLTASLVLLAGVDCEGYTLFMYMQIIMNSQKHKDSSYFCSAYTRIACIDIHIFGVSVLIQHTEAENFKY